MKKHFKIHNNKNNKINLKKKYVCKSLLTVLIVTYAA